MQIWSDIVMLPITALWVPVEPPQKDIRRIDSSLSLLLKCIDLEERRNLPLNRGKSLLEQLAQLYSGMPEYCDCHLKLNSVNTPPSIACLNCEFSTYFHQITRLQVQANDWVQFDTRQPDQNPARSSSSLRLWVRRLIEFDVDIPCILRYKLLLDLEMHLTSYIDRSTEVRTCTFRTEVKCHLF